MTAMAPATTTTMIVKTKMMTKVRLRVRAAVQKAWGGCLLQEGGVGEGPLLLHDPVIFVTSPLDTTVGIAVMAMVMEWKIVE